MKYKAALFDMDGVIIDSEPLHLAAFRQTLESHNMVLTTEQYNQFFAGRTDDAGIRLYLNSTGGTVDFSHIMHEKARNYIKLASGQSVAYSGIVSFIKNLSKKMPLALVTDSLRVEATTALSALDIIECFQVIISADDVEEGKPSPEGYLRARDLLNIPSEDCVIVEDAPSGILAAKNAGIDCIALTHTHAPEKLSAATKVVGNLTLNLF